MSWMKRPGAEPAGYPAPAPAPPAPAPAPQGYGNEQNMYPNYQTNAANSQQQQYWPQQQQQPAQYNQQYGVVYQQQEYRANNANQMYPQYNQNYANQTYNTTQQSYQQSYYPNQQQQVQQSYGQVQNKDNWDDNWDWGWEESAKQAQQAAAQQQAAAVPSGPIHQPPAAFNNANVIEESFTSTNTWNWSMDDKKETKQNPVSVPPPSTLPPAQREPAEPATLHSESPAVGTSTASEHTDQRSASNLSAQSITEEVRTLNDKDIVKERLPNLALGKRFHLENLTPQWSIESQMSQESSDGVQTHSESTYLSENQSRNSNSSPGLNTEHYNSHSGFDESLNADWSRHSTEEGTLTDNTQKNFMPQDDEDVRNTLQELSLANRENSTLDSVDQDEARNVSEQYVPPPVSQPAAPQPTAYISNTPVCAGLPPLPPPPALTGLPQPSSSVNLPPSFPSGSQNPFKSAGPFSHKSIKSSTGTPTGSQLAPMPKDLPSQSATNLTSPAAVNKIQQSRPPMGVFSANLETTPDNSERPDQPQVTACRLLATPAQVPDNLEVAPQNDRNEYLQTAHLSSSDYGENTDFSRNMPPPGLRRMVVGQQESEYGQSLNMSSDEPPPGLSRMVPGQQTEADNSYNQPSESYMDRHIDGQPMDSSTRPYRQTADGQQTPDFTQGPNRASRPIGMDRMVPGEPSNEEYPQYQNPNFNTNDQRVVTGVDHEYSAGPSDIREQNMDGSDYTENAPRNPRNIPRVTRESAAEIPVDFTSAEDQQREVIMEGENLQDLSVISSTDLTFSREQTLEGADINVAGGAIDRKTDASDSVEIPPCGSRRQSLNRTSGEDSERDRMRDRRDKHKSSRDRDRERDGKYSRDDKKKERDGERRPEKDRRDRDRDRDRDESPSEVRVRRSTRSRRYETEDTDYYSDRERDRRRYREGSSKPPRPDDKDRRYRDDRDRNRRYNTIERDRRYDDERDGTTRPRRSDRDRERDRYQRRYRDIDPSRKYGNIRRERDEEDRRRGEVSSPSRPASREAPTDDDLNETLPSAESRRRHRRRHNRHEPHYDAYGAEYDPYAVQRRQYQYYEQLRLTDPAAYMQVYKKLLAGETPYVPPSFYADPYASLGYEARAGAEESRGSVHSGRSSANGLTGKDTDFNTDASLPLPLDESTRSERMTPFKFSTAHVKGSISSHHVVLVRPVYPVDGLPATVQLLQLSTALAHDPASLQLRDYPGPLLKGVTHKKSVIDYCALRVREARRGGAGAARGDVIGYVLVWELLKLMLTQNGMVVGSDIAELLMKNQREYELNTTSPRTHHTESGRGSSERSRDVSGDASPAPPPASDPPPGEEEGDSSLRGIEPETDPGAADLLLEYLIAGNRQQALECAMSNNLWGHALHLSQYASRRTRGAVLQRFLAHLPRTSPLHTLYCSLAGQLPPAATCVSEARWGDWRPHAAILLSNSGSRPEHDQKTLIQLGDSLNSRGLLFSAQFCYLSAGAPFSPHPLAPLTPPAPPPVPPPRLSLLLADPKAHTLGTFASNEAIFATEIYEYAMSLHQEFVMPDLQVYKFLLATRLVDAGQFGRALAYTERVARAVTAAPATHALLVPRVADLADRLKYHEPPLSEEDPPLEESGGSASPSPRHRQWQDDIQHVALALTAEGASQQSTPQHELYTSHAAPPAPAPALAPPQQTYEQYGWGDQSQPQYQPPAPPAAEPPPAAPAAAPAHDYAQYYQPPPDQQQYSYQEDWYSKGAEEPDPGYYPYTEVTSASDEQRPTITMPGTAPPGGKPSLYTDFDDTRPDNGHNEPESEADASRLASKKEESKGGSEGGKGGQKTGWLGGILTKLSLRPPNQMILPDDKNPTIVWDPETKRWRNTDGTEEEPDRAPPPPPRLTPANTNSASVPTAGVLPPAPGGAPTPVSNIFKMQKGRHIKKSYVDVFNPSGAAPRAAPPAAELLPPAPAPPPANYFVPSPMSHDQSAASEHALGQEDSRWDQ